MISRATSIAFSLFVVECFVLVDALRAIIRLVVAGTYFVLTCYLCRGVLLFGATQDASPCKMDTK